MINLQQRFESLQQVLQGWRGKRKNFAELQRLLERLRQRVNAYGVTQAAVTGAMVVGIGVVLLQSGPNSNGGVISASESGPAPTVPWGVRIASESHQSAQAEFDESEYTVVGSSGEWTGGDQETRARASTPSAVNRSSDSNPE